MRIVSAKHVKKLDAESKTRLRAIKIKKEMGRMLLPDAPPTKRKRDKSPERYDCALTPGTPTTAPPSVQKWKKVQESTVQSIPVVHELDITRVVSNVEIEIIETSEATPTEEFHHADSDESDAEKDRVSFTRDLPIVLFEDILDSDDDPNYGSEVEEEVEVPFPTTVQQASDSHAELPPNINPATLHQILNLDRQDDNYLQGMTDADKLQFDWRQDLNIFEGVKEVFTGSSGPTFEFDSSSPLAILEKIWDSEIVSLIVEQTNIYAQQLMLNSQLKAQSRMKTWKPITESDIWIFFCILILQSLDPRAPESDYWYSKLDILDMPKFRTVMPYKKFIQIKKCLHFVNNLTQNLRTDKTAKIKPIIVHLDKKFSQLYTPQQEISLDESLLLWKGRLNFAQKIGNKAAGVGLKTYEICESKSGYLWSFRLYTGKDGTSASENTTDESPDEPNSKTSAIVFDLVRPLLNKGHILIMDNFYNSPLLSRLLKLQKTDTMGTLRLNRQFVPASLKGMKKSDLRVGEIAFSNTKDLTVILWRDSNLVALISTLHPVQISGKEKYGTYKYRPQVVLDYNKSMGGVDKKDQFLSAFPLERCRNHVWYKKLFRRLFNVSITNSWIIMTTKKKISHRAFREQLVLEILAKYQIKTNQVVNVNPSHKAQPLLVGGHYVIQGKSKRAKCRLCSMQGKDSRTSRICDVCLIPLCVYPCFKNYHTKKY